MSALTVALSVDEAAVLEELAARKDLSKTALMRQSLRLYQMIDDRLCKGQTLAFIDGNGDVVRTKIFGIGPID